MPRRTVPVVEAARRLKISYNGARDLVLRGRLRGEQDQWGHWRVDELSLEQEVARRAVKVAKA